jgi:hypothetical protein
MQITNEMDFDISELLAQLEGTGLLTDEGSEASPCQQFKHRDRAITESHCHCRSRIFFQSMMGSYPVVASQISFRFVSN